MPIFRRKRAEPPPPDVPEGYVAVRDEDTDKMLRPIVDEVFAIGETEVRRYVGLQFMMEAMNHVAEEKGDAIKYVSSACALGYFARRVEFRVLKLDEFNETVQRLP